jgi:hypothetical protein
VGVRILGGVRGPDPNLILEKLLLALELWIDAARAHCHNLLDPAASRSFNNMGVDQYVVYQDV